MEYRRETDFHDFKNIKKYILINILWVQSCCSTAMCQFNDSGKIVCTIWRKLYPLLLPHWTNNIPGVWRFYKTVKKC